MVVFSQEVKSSVRVMQEVEVLCLESPPQIVFLFRLWPYLLSGKSGNMQCCPVAGTNTSTNFMLLAPVIIKAKYND